ERLEPKACGASVRACSRNLRHSCQSSTPSLRRPIGPREDSMFPSLYSMPRMRERVVTYRSASSLAIPDSANHAKREVGLEGAQVPACRRERSRWRGFEWALWPIDPG